MIKVECESCKAPYELDERRIPDKGMKMRCPKCGTSFVVTKGSPPAGGAAIAPPANPKAPAIAPPPGVNPTATPSVKRTMLGQGPPQPAIAPPPSGQRPLGPKGTVAGIAPPAAAGRAKPVAAKPPAGSLAPPSPAPGPLAPPPAKPAARPPAAKGVFGATMLGAAPAPPAAAPAPAPGEVVDLPGVSAGRQADRQAGRRAGGQEGGPQGNAFGGASRRSVQDLSLSNIQIDDLPAPKAEVDLPAPRASGRGAAPDLGTLDLPAPKQPATPPADFGSVDLPAAKPPQQSAGFGGVDLPARKEARPEPAFGGVDLPAPKSAEPEFGSVDLPAPKPGQAPGFGSVDLPAPKGDDRDPFGQLDLPKPKGEADPFGQLDLPAPLPQSAGFGGATDLPVPKGHADLPAPRSNGLDLPAAKGGADLPAPKLGGGGFGDLDLPAPRDDLPAPRGGDVFGGLELPDLPAPRDDLPRPAHEASFGDIDLPPPRADAGLIPPKARTVQGMGPGAAHDEASFGDLDLGEERDSELPPSLLSGDDEASFGDLDFGDAPPGTRAHPTAAGHAPPMAPPLDGEPLDDLDLEEVVEEEALSDDDLVAPHGAGAPGGYYDEGDGYGQDYGQDYDEDGGWDDDEYEDDEDMEFGIEGASDDARGFSLPPEILRRQRGEEFDAKQEALGRRSLKVIAGAAGVLLLLGGGGAALGLTKHGVFGMYLIEQKLPDAGSPQFARQAIEKAERIAQSDTYADVKRSLKELGQARGEAGLNRELWTRSIVHEGLSMLRFGDDPQSAAHIAAIMKRLEERSFDAPGMELARAADAARRKRWDEAQRHLAAARGQSPNDVYVDLLAGEIALVQGKLDDAEKAFGKALQNRGGARAQWGLARVELAGEDADAQSAAVEETLKLSPNHVEARIAEARVAWLQGKEDRALHLLRVAIGLEPTDDDTYLWSSKGALAAGYGLLGYTHETRNRTHQARPAYDKALEADPYRVEALLGAGRVLLREGRHGDALARFEAALSTATKGGNNPVALSGRRADAEAQLGIGRALLALDRAPDAKARLESLVATLSNDPDVVVALGRTEQALDNPEAAEAHFRRAMELAPDAFDGYLALAQLFQKLGEAGKASEVLNEAMSHVPETAEMRRMLGESELARNRLDSALHEFKRALLLDPQDFDAMFGMGVVLRRGGDLGEAKRVFEMLSTRAPDYARLPEERGRLFEAEGEHGKAVDAYAEALEKDPTNTALLLRKGAAQVEAGDLDAAEQTLDKVIREHPNSAEAEYFIGRVEYKRGRTPDALTHFSRAVSLDATKGEYHLYVARASLDSKNYLAAAEAIDQALKLDPSLGDAYWVDGMIKLRMGAVKDAIKLLNKALSLNPARVEAHKVIGDCYTELRDLPKAIAAYRTALEQDANRGEWWYKLGVLYADIGNRGESQKAVERAIALGRDADPPPYWLADAYRLGGEAAEIKRNRAQAIRYYKSYRELSSPEHIDRRTIDKKLREWGVELSEEG